MKLNTSIQFYIKKQEGNISVAEVESLLVTQVKQNHDLGIFYSGLVQFVNGNCKLRLSNFQGNRIIYKEMLELLSLM